MSISFAAASADCLHTFAFVLLMVQHHAAFDFDSLASGYLALALVLGCDLRGAGAGADPDLDHADSDFAYIAVADVSFYS